jgi:hypothetical protein
MLFLDSRKSSRGISFPLRTPSSMTAPRPRGRPYCRLERAVRREEEVWRVKIEGPEEEEGRWPDNAA